jgi:hypothetical protein
MAAKIWWFNVPRLLVEDLLVARAEEARSPTVTRAVNATSQRALARLM